MHCDGSWGGARQEELRDSARGRDDGEKMERGRGERGDIVGIE